MVHSVVSRHEIVVMPNFTTEEGAFIVRGDFGVINKNAIITLQGAMIVTDTGSYIKSTPVGGRGGRAYDETQTVVVERFDGERLQSALKELEKP